MHRKYATKMSRAFPLPTFPPGNQNCLGTLFSFRNKELTVPKKIRSQANFWNAKCLFLWGKHCVPTFPPYKGGMCFLGKHTYPIAISDLSGWKAEVRNGRD